MFVRGPKADEERGGEGGECIALGARAAPGEQEQIGFVYGVGDGCNGPLGGGRKRRGACCSNSSNTTGAAAK